MQAARVCVQVVRPLRMKAERWRDHKLQLSYVWRVERAPIVLKAGACVCPALGGQRKEDADPSCLVCLWPCSHWPCPYTSKPIDYVAMGKRPIWLARLLLPRAQVLRILRRRRPKRCILLMRVPSVHGSRPVPLALVVDLQPFALKSLNGRRQFVDRLRLVHVFDHRRRSHANALECFDAVLTSDELGGDRLPLEAGRMALWHDKHERC